MSFPIAEPCVTSVKHAARAESPNLASHWASERREQILRCDDTIHARSKASRRANGAVSSRRLRTLRLGHARLPMLRSCGLRTSHRRSADPRRERRGLDHPTAAEEAWETAIRKPQVAASLPLPSNMDISPQQTSHRPGDSKMGLRAWLPKTLPGMHVRTTHRKSRCSLELNGTCNSERYPSSLPGPLRDSTPCRAESPTLGHWFSGKYIWKPTLPNRAAIGASHAG